MISEAVATAAPVLVAELPGRSRRSGAVPARPDRRRTRAALSGAVRALAGRAAGRHRGGGRGDVPPARLLGDAHAGHHHLRRPRRRQRDLQGAGPPAGRRGDRAALRAPGRNRSPWSIPTTSAAALLALLAGRAADRRPATCRTWHRWAPRRAGRVARPLTDLPRAEARSVLIAAFDAGRDRRADRNRSLPEGATLVTLDEVRLPEAMLTNPRRYLDRLNFATNFVFFREQDGPLHAAGHGQLLGRLRRRRGAAVAAAVRRRGRRAGDLGGGRCRRAPGGIVDRQRGGARALRAAGVHRPVVPPCRSAPPGMTW